ncbi:hypothetical protein PCCS19_17330 [Paenibacillus sp. CCS19]|uniref:hypothetical protein n=1 Tax=Paenibacillus sp. CCS19 TaxID=3158387 RepID=UPI002561B906|nr:hypothetical protein [Paenibacillus cellulosilyticus]GMK38679.1 hypothetical protein PCCS19_17330 [Paenibacillus cellulosilyticus]
MHLSRITGSAVCAVLLTVSLAACQAADDYEGATPSTLASSQNAETVSEDSGHLTDVTISEAAVDWDNDGKMEKLLIKLSDGKLVNYPDPGPIEGDCYVGQFAAVLTDDAGDVLQSRDLGMDFDESMTFRKDQLPFEIPFDDYNGDGYMEFTVGQYASSNGNIFNLYTIQPEGISRIGGPIFTSDKDGYYSTRYAKKPPSSFLNRYYDNRRGETFESTFEWINDAFVKQGEKVVVFHEDAES